MARHSFFSFHYQNDIQRVNIVRNSGVLIGQAAAGFRDASLWEEAKLKGDAFIKKMIDDALVGTSVTVVLIGSQTAERKYVNYEIRQSIARGNGILGIHINNIADWKGDTKTRGAVPALLVDGGYPAYDWPFDAEKFSAWIEAAVQRAKS